MSRYPRLKSASVSKTWMAGTSQAMTESEVPLMHRGEKPRQPKTRQPGPHRLAAHAEIPGADHGIGPADQIVDRQQSDAAVAHRDAAVGGVVPVVAEHEQLSRRHRHFRRVVEPAIVLDLEDRVADAVRQRLDE